MARSAMDGLAQELARQREALGSRAPAYGRALDLLPAVLAGPAGRFVEAAWEHRRFQAWYDRPLLLLAALRNDALAAGEDHPLFAAFAAPDAAPGAVTEERLASALDGTRETVFDALARRGVQTNETSRAVVWLWPAALAGVSRGRPVALADVGASAGLNLVADALPPIWTASDGAPVEVVRDVRAIARLGLDPSPLDPLKAEDARWLRACIWPGEREREERLDAALAAFRAARTRPDAPVLVPIAASNVPARLDRLSAAEAGALVLAYQTLMRDYLDPTERDEYEAGMRDWLGTHPAGSALWVELEPSGSKGDDTELGAAIVAHVRTRWGALRDVELARCNVHPRRIAPTADGADELRSLLEAEQPEGVWT